MDSLLLKQIQAELHSIQDSLTTHAAKIQETVDSIKSESWFLKLLPFLGVIIGALLAYFSQRLIRKAEVKENNLRFINEAKNKILTTITMLRFQLKELAYLEVDSKYQLYQSLTDTGTEEKKKALEEHYNDYKFITGTKTKIVEGVAHINTAFSTYFKCKGELFPDETMATLNNFTEHILDLPIPPEYPVKPELACTTVDADVQKLRLEYTKNIAALKAAGEGL